MKKIWFAVAAASTLFLGTNAMAQDAAAGEKIFNAKCKACHTVQAGKNMVGPSLFGILGRTAGSVEGFKYSDANKNSGVKWTAETLDPYLTDPKAFMPGNKMVFPGLKDATERANVIAYLSAQK